MTDTTDNNVQTNKHDSVQIVGRTSSHFTRVAVIFATELGVRFDLVPVYDLSSLETGDYEGNPALKIPTLRRGDELLFGTENICRSLAKEAGAPLRIVWPEQLTTAVAQNAQELVWHAMAAQVQLILATYVGKIPVDNGYIVKVRQGYEGALRWLDGNLAVVRETLPAARDLSLLEVTLFCLIEHIVFRPMVALDPYPILRGFANEYAKRASAESTKYRMDRKPSA